MAGIHATFLALCLCCLHSVLGGPTNTQILNLYKSKFTGDGTYYGVGDKGTCSYAPPHLPPVASDPRINAYVALNHPQFAGSLACGMCFKVHGTGHGLGNDPIKGDKIVFVKDLCPECLAGSLDFALNGDGRWDIEIQAIQCPVGNTKIEYKFQGSNPWYIKLQIRNARIPATHVEIYQSHSRVWKALKHTSDGFWVFNPNDHYEKPVPENIQVRLTSAHGDQLEDNFRIRNGDAFMNEVVIHGRGVQFPLIANLPH